MKHSIATELTKTHLADTLLKLLLEKPLNKITVKELATRAKVNRQTFYYHFSDMHDLLEWLLKQKLHSIITNIETFTTWQNAGIYLLDYLKENRALVLSTLNSLSRNTVKALIYSEISKLASKFVYELASDIRASETAFNHVIHFFCISFSALLEDWLTSNNPRSSEDLIAELDLIVSGLARNALTRYAIREGAL